jgi:carboxymethylenebutenolidase
MKAKNITVKLRDGEMGAYLAIPDRVPAGAIIATMEIWGVNDTMRHHAHEFAQAGFICLVPDLFWRYVWLRCGCAGEICGCAY